MCIILLILRNFINFTIHPRFQSNNAKLQEHSSFKKTYKKFPEIILVISYPNERMTLNFSQICP